MRRAQRGQSSVEYAVICAAIALALGIGMADSGSVLWQLVDAMRSGYRKFTYAISISE
jgi:Flp pilus assembly pilin Flp